MTDPNPFLLKHSKEKQKEDEQPVDFLSELDCTGSTSTLPPINVDRQLQNIMDCILPPSTWKEDELFWRQKTSTAPVTRMDIAILEETFDKQLQTRVAKPFGICPIRRQLYDQLFGELAEKVTCKFDADELIRQTTVSCAERGLLLLRVRDEIRMSILAYQSLLESAIGYGLRKALSVENEQYRSVVERDDERKKNGDLIGKWVSHTHI